jgi:hypothetical protein
VPICMTLMEEIRMASRRTSAEEMELQRLSRAAVALLREVEEGRDPAQIRVIIDFVNAMFSASRARSVVHLADLGKVDDVQFEKIVSALCYVRRAHPSSSRRGSVLPVNEQPADDNDIRPRKKLDRCAGSS